MEVTGCGGQHPGISRGPRTAAAISLASHLGLHFYVVMLATDHKHFCGLSGFLPRHDLPGGVWGTEGVGCCLCLVLWTLGVAQ